MEIKHKILMFVLSFVIILSSFTNSYYNANALGLDASVTTSQAFSYLLSLFGIIETGSVLDNDLYETWQTDYANNWESYGEIDYESAFASASEWLENLKNGVLDKTSTCWKYLKSWLSGGLSNPTGIEMLDRCLEASGLNVEIDSSQLDFNIQGCCVLVPTSSSGYYRIFLFPESTTIKQTYSTNAYAFTFSNSLNVCSQNINILNNSSVVLQPSSTISYSTNINNLSYVYYMGLVNNFGYTDKIIEVTSSSISDDIMGIEGDLDDVTIVGNGATTIEDEGTVSLPWQNVDEEAFENLIEAVLEGTISLEELQDTMLDLVNASAVDTTTGLDYPSGDSTTSEEVEENNNNQKYLIYGLEEFFPFCIPFDVYEFMKILQAEPTAPIIHYPFYNPITETSLEITIDFSEWESVVILFRYIFDFLFIVGLMLGARKLIGGDD